MQDNAYWRNVQQKAYCQNTRPHVRGMKFFGENLNSSRAVVPAIYYIEKGESKGFTGQPQKHNQIWKEDTPQAYIFC
jgi:hypothetical protein